jgi:hypothetical protein
MKQPHLSLLVTADNTSFTVVIRTDFYLALVWLVNCVHFKTVVKTNPPITTEAWEFMQK